MLASSLVVISLAASAYSGVAIRRRGQASVITSCSVPNTAAMTFVRTFATMSDLLFTPPFPRTMVLISISKRVLVFTFGRIS